MKNIRITGLALAALFAAGCASGPMGWGEADVGFAQWDMDGNGLVGNDEFGVGFDNNDWFDTWDTDRDGLLSDDEFGVGSAGLGIDDNDFGMWDADDDGFLGDDEFGAGVFGEWDINDDGFLDANEFGMEDDWFG